MELLSLWFQFMALAAVIGVAGYYLSVYADIIAGLTGIGRNLIGLILLATITSLPELMSGISAVRFADDPNLAVGDILGSCVFNLALVFFLDLMHRETSVYEKANTGHILSGALGMILISFVGYSLIISPIFPNFVLGQVGGFTLFIPIFYLLAMRTLYSFENKQNFIGSNTNTNTREISEISLIRACSLFGIAALFVIATGIILPFLGEKIVVEMGWNSAFVGTIFMAFATSIPEIAVTISAIHLKAVDLAFSNLLGSNLFNVVILAVDDLFYTRGNLLKDVSPSHVITAFSAVMMTGLVLVALIQPPQKRILNTVSILSLLLIAVFFLNAYIIFSAGA